MPLTTYTAGEVLTAASLNANFSFAAAGGKLGQVVSTNLASTFSTSAVAYTDITGLSVSITPTAATSKVLVLVGFQASVSADIAVMFQLVRGSTAIDIGDAAGSRSRASFANVYNDNLFQLGTFNLNFLDSPNTTSATTYKMQMFTNSGTAYVNRTGLDNDAATRPRTAANITVWRFWHDRLCSNFNRKLCRQRMDTCRRRLQRFSLA